MPELNAIELVCTAGAIRGQALTATLQFNQPFMLGRSSKLPQPSLILANDTGVSARHAKIFFRWNRGKPAAYLQDEGSSNGTWRDGKKLPARRPYKLTQAQSFLIGGHTFLIRKLKPATACDDSEQPAPAPAAPAPIPKLCQPSPVTTTATAVQAHRPPAAPTPAPPGQPADQLRQLEQTLEQLLAQRNALAQQLGHAQWTMRPCSPSSHACPAQPDRAAPGTPASAGMKRRSSKPTSVPNSQRQVPRLTPPVSAVSVHLPRSRFFDSQPGSLLASYTVGSEAPSAAALAELPSDMSAAELASPIQQAAQTSPARIAPASSPVRQASPRAVTPASSPVRQASPRAVTPASSPVRQASPAAPASARRDDTALTPDGVPCPSPVRSMRSPVSTPGARHVPASRPQSAYSQSTAQSTPAHPVSPALVSSASCTLHAVHSATPPKPATPLYSSLELRVSCSPSATPVASSSGARRRSAPLQLPTTAAPAMSSGTPPPCDTGLQLLPYPVPADPGPPYKMARPALVRALLREYGMVSLGVHDLDAGVLEQLWHACHPAQQRVTSTPPYVDLTAQD